MTKTAQQVLLDALHLSQPERATVANSLLESLDPPPPDKEGDHEEWLGEIERRARAALAGKPGVPWGDARARILKRLDLE
jgi:putative addiction module component (TIGR02574 family)